MTSLELRDGSSLLTKTSSYRLTGSATRNRMKEIISTFKKLEKELLQLVSEKCESESDIRRQELRLKQINAKLKCIGTELKQRRQALKQRHARLFN